MLVSVFLYLRVGTHQRMYLSGCTRQKPISSPDSETFLHEELEADITKARSVMITFRLLVSRCCAQDSKAIQRYRRHRRDGCVGAAFNSSVDVG